MTWRVFKLNHTNKLFFILPLSFCAFYFCTSFMPLDFVKIIKLIWSWNELENFIYWNFFFYLLLLNMKNVLTMLNRMKCFLFVRLFMMENFFSFCLKIFKRAQKKNSNCFLKKTFCFVINSCLLSFFVLCNFHSIRIVQYVYELLSYLKGNNPLKAF